MVRVLRDTALLVVVSLGIAGCAVSRESADFAVTASGSGSKEFLSSKELLVSGLVSESIGIAGRGRLFDAEARLRKALVLAPGDPAITYNLAVVLGQQGHLDEATQLLRTLRASQGDHPRYAIAMADAYVGQGKLALGREQLKLAFEAFSQAENWPQAALVARSISNLAFAEGLEQESLCYSYEAFQLAPSASELGYHGSLLVAMNQHSTADSFLGEQIALNPGVGAGARVHLARALARGALGNTKGAVEEIELAQDLLAQEPELGSEVNVVWWLLKKQQPETPEDAQDTKLQESLEAVVPEVARLKDKPTYAMVRWPQQLLAMLSSASIAR
ncbi:MAG: tetratricopeptide repeat protein [Pseudomonadota bacterium]